MLRFALVLLAFAFGAIPLFAAELLPDFRRSAFFNEQVRMEKTPEGVRVAYNAPAVIDPEKPTLVIFYATPNGNTIEQTLGCARAPGLDWHYDIQHIAAQTRRLREVDTRENICLVVVEAEGRSWPAWRRKHDDALIRSLVETAAARFPGKPRRIALTGHSGGGSFLFGYLNAAKSIPDDVERIAFLDANYSYSDEDRHGDKLLDWLHGDPKRQLVVLAYDDRNIVLDGKPVVGPTGGTYRATYRMLARFRRDAELSAGNDRSLDVYTRSGGQATFLIDRNASNKILHTVLVETNGFLEAMTLGTPEEKAWGTYRGERAYTKWIQPAELSAPVGTSPMSAIPPRPTDAEGGAAFIARIAPMTPADREAAILAEFLRGNVPDFLRTAKVLEAASEEPDGTHHTVRFGVLPDYLAVGSDADFVRMPMTPMTAQRLANAWGCILPTRRIADLCWQDAEVKLEPHPLTVDRESVPTFVEFNRIIEEQRGNAPLGQLIAGIKKDVVVTNRLAEKPHRVAIYGWHHQDGYPIQPLYVGHVDWYVDYSHGIRLVQAMAMVDGKSMAVPDILKDPHLSALLSDEGPIPSPRY